MQFVAAGLKSEQESQQCHPVHVCLKAVLTMHH